MQQTIANHISYTGIGLHSGQPVTIELHPAPEDTGIVFCRTDLSNAPCVAAGAAQVTDTMRATTLEDGTAKVFTVEHLLAALRVFGIDNCRVDISSPEPPVADGSAIVFWQLLERAGSREQKKRRLVRRVAKEYIVRDADKFIAILPYDGLRISFTSVNPHPFLGVQYFDCIITPESFVAEIAQARTIGFLHEIEALQAQGLALGGSLENAVVYDQNGSVNEPRFTDELVRHKVLDVIGDLALAGIVRGHVIAVKSSHALNTALAKQLLDIEQEEE
ncbi:UDP-3-O-acyl-N-acetylglucosamine deacetylase [Azotosporobacter soli]|uniref:UDP-3-O-acyl-N-acetylglucosamine deacetylase n=1 Tax=Azotosporobacter soli TaxID=3055040 RepID=UPI0031FE5D43